MLTIFCRSNEKCSLSKAVLSSNWLVEGDSTPIEPGVISQVGDDPSLHLRIQGLLKAKPNQTNCHHAPVHATVHDLTWATPSNYNISFITITCQLLPIPTPFPRARTTRFYQFSVQTFLTAFVSHTVFMTAVVKAVNFGIQQNVRPFLTISHCAI